EQKRLRGGSRSGQRPLLPRRGSAVKQVALVIWPAARKRWYRRAFVSRVMKRSLDTRRRNA
ncbi:MAG: hypothetical protein DME22_09245, partial [Verrucomicrobia bacterium]